MISVPGFAAGRRSCQTDSTCLPAGSIVTTASASRTASAPEPAIRTPSALAASQEAAARSKPITLCPGLDEVRGHRAAHVAEPDEGDGGHVLPSAHRLTPAHRSGSGMNSVSPGTLSKRAAFQSAFACSMRSLREETKFHQM